MCASRLLEWRGGLRWQTRKDLNDGTFEGITLDAERETGLAPTHFHLEPNADGSHTAC